MTRCPILSKLLTGSHFKVRRQNVTYGVYYDHANRVELYETKTGNFITYYPRQVGEGRKQYLTRVAFELVNMMECEAI